MKQYLLLFLLVVVTISLNAQTTIVEFEPNVSGKEDCNPTPEWLGDPNAPVVTKIANPSVGGLNTTATCVQYIETAGSHMGNSLQWAFVGGTTEVSGHNLHTGSPTNKFVKFLVYSVNKTTFDILLELGTGGAPNFSGTQTVTTALNTWTEVEFDFSSTVTTNWNSNIRIHFNNGTSGAGDTYYVDEYTIAATSTLPVELVSFSGIKKNESVELTWETASEENNDKFEIERSQNGKEFKTISEVAGNGTTLDFSEYYFIDEAPEMGINYYRLKQIDYDGRYEYSDIISMKMTNEESELHVFPTIATSHLNVNYEGSSVDILVYNQLGVEVMQQSLNMNSGTHQLSVADLPNGLYYLVAQSGTTKQTVKFIKQ
jgi:hypothetical protein